MIVGRMVFIYNPMLKNSIVNLIGRQTVSRIKSHILFFTNCVKIAQIARTPLAYPLFLGVSDISIFVRAAR